MINRKELAICKRRGHNPEGYREKWEHCKYCGMWSRTITTKEEREDAPPESQQDPLYALERQIKRFDESRIVGKPARGKGK